MSKKKVEFIAFGTDPEVFLVDNKGNAVSAEGLIGGTKEEPIPISEHGHALQEDNVMVEFNIPPVRDAGRLKREISFCLKTIKNRVGYEIAIVPSILFTEEQLSTDQGAMFGCSPDNDVWSRMENPTVEPEANRRYAGGHIHISYNKFTPEVTEDLVKAMDLFLGVPSVIMDSDENRKRVYGKAGRFRFTEYGFEYRTLSNFWLVNEDLMEWAFNQTMLAIDYVNEENEIKQFAEKIQTCINTNNAEMAKDICKENNIKLLQHVRV
jgi:hypothetical protein